MNENEKLTIKVYAAGVTPILAVTNLMAGLEFNYGGDGLVYPSPNGYTFSRFACFNIPAVGNMKSIAFSFYARGFHIPGGCVITNLDKCDQFEFKEITHPMLAMGDSKLNAIMNLARDQGWEEVSSWENMNDGDSAPEFTWGARFTADGTSFKCAGFEQDGYFVLTWWK